jgi:hypothetical protein
MASSACSAAVQPSKGAVASDALNSDLSSLDSGLLKDLLLPWEEGREEEGGLEPHQQRS